MAARTRDVPRFLGAADVLRNTVESGAVDVLRNTGEIFIDEVNPCGRPPWGIEGGARVGRESDSIVRIRSQYSRMGFEGYVRFEGSVFVLESTITSRLPSCNGSHTCSGVHVPTKAILPQNFAISILNTTFELATTKPVVSGVRMTDEEKVPTQFPNLETVYIFELLLLNILPLSAR